MTQVFPPPHKKFTMQPAGVAGPQPAPSAPRAPAPALVVDRTPKPLAAEIPAEVLEERARALATGWPIPPEGPWCLRYNREIRQMPGFYDPPDLYVSPVRTARIDGEYPEIHAWADLIAEAWYGKPFRKVMAPARRNRIVGAMLFAAHGEGNARIAGVEPYMQLLQKQATERAVSWMVAIANALALAIGSLAGGPLLRKNHQMAKGAAGLLAEIADVTEAVGAIAIKVQTGEITDLDAAGAIAAEVLDALDDLTELAPGQLDNKTLASIGKRIRQGLDAAAALAAAVHED